MSFIEPLSMPAQLGCLFLAAFAAIGADQRAFAADDDRQFYEIRQYVIGEGSDGAPLDEYLSSALVPALRRAGTGPVGVFGPAENSESQDRFVVIPYSRIDQVPEVNKALAVDSDLASAANALEAAGNDKPAYKRILSELLVAMKSMPELKAPENIGTDQTRVYELRTYESANERLGNRKVEMFDSGEVPIFLDSGIIPVFLGQTIVGPYTPSLTYLTAYADEAARVEAWKTFVAHPDWKQLSGEAKYQGTVSKIHKYVLRPLPGSQL